MAVTPARAAEISGVRATGSVVLALSVVSVGPFAGHRRSSQSCGPPAHVLAAGRRALPRLRHYYEPSDSSEGVGLLFPFWLWRRLPDLQRSADRAIVDDQPPEVLGPGVGCQDCSGPYEVPLDHLACVVTTPRRNHLQQPWSLGRSGDERQGQPGGHRRDQILGFPVRRRVATAAGLLPVHCSFEAAVVPPPPSDPSSPRRPGHRLPNFNDQSSGRTFTSSLAKLPGVRRATASAPKRRGSATASPESPQDAPCERSPPRRAFERFARPREHRSDTGAHGAPGDRTRLRPRRPVRDLWRRARRAARRRLGSLPTARSPNRDALRPLAEASGRYLRLRCVPVLRARGSSHRARRARAPARGP